MSEKNNDPTLTLAFSGSGDGFREERRLYDRPNLRIVGDEDYSNITQLFGATALEDAHNEPDEQPQNPEALVEESLFVSFVMMHALEVGPRDRRVIYHGVRRLSDN